MIKPARRRTKEKERETVPIEPLTESVSEDQQVAELPQLERSNLKGVATLSLIHEAKELEEVTNDPNLLLELGLHLYSSYSLEFDTFNNYLQLENHLEISYRDYRLLVSIIEESLSRYKIEGGCYVYIGNLQRSTFVLQRVKTKG